MVLWVGVTFYAFVFGRNGLGCSSVFGSNGIVWGLVLLFLAFGALFVGFEACGFDVWCETGIVRCLTLRLDDKESSRLQLSIRNLRSSATNAFFFLSLRLLSTAASLALDSAFSFGFLPRTTASAEGPASSTAPPAIISSPCTMAVNIPTPGRLPRSIEHPDRAQR